MPELYPDPEPLIIGSGSGSIFVCYGSDTHLASIINIIIMTYITFLYLQVSIDIENHRMLKKIEHPDLGLNMSNSFMNKDKLSIKDR